MFRLYQPETLFFKYKRHYMHLLIQSPNTPLLFIPQPLKNESHFYVKVSAKKLLKIRKCWGGGGEGQNIRKG